MHGAYILQCTRPFAQDAESSRIQAWPRTQPTVKPSPDPRANARPGPLYTSLGAGAQIDLQSAGCAGSRTGSPTAVVRPESRHRPSLWPVRVLVSAWASLLIRDARVSGVSAVSGIASASIDDTRHRARCVRKCAGLVSKDPCRTAREAICIRKARCADEDMRRQIVSILRPTEPSPRRDDGEVAACIFFESVELRRCGRQAVSKCIVVARTFAEATIAITPQGNHA